MRKSVFAARKEERRRVADEAMRSELQKRAMGFTSGMGGFGQNSGGFGTDTQSQNNSSDNAEIGFGSESNGDSNDGSDDSDGGNGSDKQD